MSSDPPRGGGPPGESVGFQRTRATKRMGAGAVVRDGDGRVLVVKPTYKTVWELPGGAVEHDESPAAACERELREELGLDLTVGAMLCVDYNSATEDYVESLMFLFDAGILDDASVAAIRLDPAELVECRFVTVDQAVELLDQRVGRRLAAALSSAARPRCTWKTRRFVDRRSEAEPVCARGWRCGKRQPAGIDRRVYAPDVDGGTDRVTGVSVVLFDFFGTLATYEPDRSRLAYPVAHDMAGSFGYAGNHDRFVTDWHAASNALESATAESHVEFSMTDAASAFSDRCDLGLTVEQSVAMGECFVREWQEHVVPLAGVAEMLLRLAESYRLGVVSNTHHSTMVPDFLAGMGVAEVMSLVVLSVDHGFRKPHPSIYEHCLAELGVAPSDVLFVGDSFEAGYRGPRLAGMDAALITDEPGAVVAPDRWVRTVLDVEALLAG